MSVYKKISDDCRTFESDSDFLKYYEKNRETIDEINTRALNLKFKINGFKIGRKEGKIILYPINNVVSKVNSNEDSDVNLKQEVEELKLRINIIENILNDLLKRDDVPKSNVPSTDSMNPQLLRTPNTIPIAAQKYKWTF